MNETSSVPVVFYFMALAAVLYMGYNFRRVLRIRKGRPDPFRPIKVLSSIGNSLVFGIGQKGVFSKRFTYASIMHFLLGWGFIELVFATTVDFFIARGWMINILPAKDSPWFAFLNDLGGVMLVAGAVLALTRRLKFKPEPLPQSAFKGRGHVFGDTGILLFILVLGIGGFLAEAARLAIEQPDTAAYSWVGYLISKVGSSSSWERYHSAIWWSHAVLSLVFIALIPLTKMFHSLTALLNVSLTDRTLRGQLRPMHVSRLMEDPDTDVDSITLGAGKVEDFTWKQLLDSAACTECARCTSVCPAYATGKPLSPMKIITDIRSGLYENSHGEGSTSSLIGGRIQESELWSCTTCRACIDVCPVLIDHVPTFLDLRRHLVLSEGKPPVQASESLEKTLNHGNPWGFPRQDRLKWALDAGLDVPVMSEKRKADVLYWVGCAGSYDPRNQQVAHSMVSIFQKAGIDFAVLGNEEQCTGDSARRIGEEYLFETLAFQNIETLNTYQFNTIVTPCPHCFQTLSNEYPEYGGNYRVQHHSEFIDSLLKEGKIAPEKYITGKLTYHDACYLGRYNGIYDPPRSAIRDLTDPQNLVEMDNSRSDSFCCGAGGGNMWYDVEGGERMNIRRFQEAVNTGAETIVTACSFCMIMMDDATKVGGMEDSVNVFDIAELVNQGLDRPSS